LLGVWEELVDGGVPKAHDELAVDAAYEFHEPRFLDLELSHCCFTDLQKPLALLGHGRWVREIFRSCCCCLERTDGRRKVMHIKEEAYDGGAAYTMECASLTSGEHDAVHVCETSRYPTSFSTDLFQYFQFL
jgi:hypothetical protein